MTCNACVTHVAKALRAVPGVEAAEVNLVDQRARVVHADDLPLASLFAAVDGAGYAASATGSAK